MRAVDAIVHGLHHAWGPIEDGGPIVPRFPQRAYFRSIAQSSPRGPADFPAMTVLSHGSPRCFPEHEPVVPGKLPRVVTRPQHQVVDPRDDDQLFRF